MNIVFHNYVHKIVDQIDGNQKEKEDIYEELMIHLELSCEQMMKAGYDKKKAEKLAIKNFGESNDIGNQMQKAMFPYRKLMFLTLAITSLLYTFIIYTVHLFSKSDAHIAWLLLSVLTSSILLLFTFQLIPFLERKRWLNLTLISHILIHVYGYFLAADIINNISILLSYFSLFIIILSIVLVYRTTIYDFQFNLIEDKKHAKRLHFINITCGIVIIGASLFMLVVTLAFVESFQPFTLIFFIPLFIWIMAYIIQMILISKRKKKVAYIVSGIPFLLVLGIFLWFFTM